MRPLVQQRWLKTGSHVVARVRIDLKGLHRVRKRLANGKMAEYHYAWRGGPRIWDNTMAYRPNSIEYVDAYRTATMSQTSSKGKFQEVIDQFFESSDYKKLGERTRKDHWGNVSRSRGIEEEFGRAPISAFEDKRIRQEILQWRDTFTAGTGDNMMATMQRIISFAHERGLLSEHYLLRIRKQVKSNRASIIWKQPEIDFMIKGAPTYVSRILVAAVETGLRPGDLQILKRSDFETSNRNDGRIILKTRKSRGKNYASIPVTCRLAALIAELPEDQERIIVAADGKNFTNSDSMGRAISEWRDRLGIRRELRLYDARGTAVTRLLRAGCTLTELATHMGWSYQHAAQMVEKYAALDVDMTDGVLEKVERRERLDAKKMKA